MLALFTTAAYADENKTGTVTATKLNLRKGPGTKNAIINSLSKGQKVTVLDTTKDWYKVETSKGIQGWVSDTYVTFKNTQTSRGALSRSNAASSLNKADELIDFAKSLLGVRYVYGGTTPNGFDCSGFVKYAYGHIGITLERVSRSQATQGEAVKKTDLVPGDIVFFDTNGGNNQINHVGIYIGDGDFIHASSASSANKVVISTLESGSYARNFMAARRLF